MKRNAASKGAVRRTVAMPSTADDREITAAAKADRDAHPLTQQQLSAMVPMKSRGAKSGPLIDADGEVREMQAADMKAFRPAVDALPASVRRKAGLRDWR
jgi:hypothetical protein